MGRYEKKIKIKEDDIPVDLDIDDDGIVDTEDDIVVLHDETVSPDMFSVGELRTAISAIPDTYPVYIEDELGVTHRVLRIEKTLQSELILVITDKTLDEEGLENETL